MAAVAKVVLLLSLVANYVSALPSTLLVDLTNSTLPPSTVLAVLTCSGLFSRSPTLAGLAYTLMRPEDFTWLPIVEPIPPSPISIADFMGKCLSTPGLVKGRIRYSFKQQQVVVPNLITLAGVLDAVPLEDDSPYLPPGFPVAFDSLELWSNFTSLQATQFMYTNHVNVTTTMSKMNPGLDVHGFPFNPPLTLLPDLSLTDYIVSARLFNFFLVDGCIPGTPEHALMEEMSQNNPWPRPIAVLGYDDTLPLFGGDTFEAETNCVKGHNMGQIASTGVNNLAYFSSHAPPITTPLLQPPPQPLQPFNASKSYVAFVVGDGDNLAMVKGTRFQWFSARRAACSGTTTTTTAAKCYPLLWTLSPALQRLAPDIAAWFFQGAAATGSDYFVLPPSGHLYSYPGSMEAVDAQAFVAATEEDAVLYNSSATVDWEWLGTWGATIANFTPRYAKRGVITAVVAVNVPYLVPILEFSAQEYFKVLGGATVLFRPNEWRGDSGADTPLLHPFLRNATEVAEDLLAAPRGTVTAIYLTSDGGGRVEMFDQLAALLQGTHVEVVDAGGVSRMAIESAAAAAAAAQHTSL